MILHFTFNWPGSLQTQKGPLTSQKYPENGPKMIKNYRNLKIIQIFEVLIKYVRKENNNIFTLDIYKIWAWKGINMSQNGPKLTPKLSKNDSKWPKSDKLLIFFWVYNTIRRKPNMKDMFTADFYSFGLSDT